MCIRPINCFLNDVGRPTLTPHGDTKIPCGACFECKNLRSHDWATRVQHELGDHHHNCALTLTYDDDHLPNITEKKKEFQKFMKRLRIRHNHKILHMTSHEFGSKTQRLHHHSIVFGHAFHDLKEHSTTAKGTRLFTSKDLDRTWQNGNAVIGEANAQLGYYIASYNTKNHTQEITTTSGEICEIKDSMDASKRPAIGLNYLRRNYWQLVNSGDRLPRYYVNKMREISTMTLEKQARIIKLHGAKELDMLYDMYDALVVYEGKQTQNERDINCDIAKYDIHRQKIKQDSPFREKSFTRKENMEYNLYKEENTSYLLSGDSHETKSYSN